MANSLLSNIELLILAIKEKLTFTISANGCIILDGRLLGTLKGLFISEKKRIETIASTCQSIMKDLESVPIEKNQNYVPYIQCLEFLLSQSLSQDLSQTLKRDYIALKARLQKTQIPVSLTICNKLRNKISEWKKNEKSLEISFLDEGDILQIQDTSIYDEFVELIMHSKEVFQEFAIFCFRDKVKAEIFIQYPHLAKKLFESNLTGRIGRVNGNILIEWVNGQKIVTLPFEGKQVNILDEGLKVELRSNYVISVKEMFEIFKNKNYEVGNLEYLANGVTNWNVHKWATWNPKIEAHEQINLHHQSWWWLLPTFEVASRKEIENRYGITLEADKWCVSATATSLTKTLDYENTHAFLEIAIPHGNGTYQILDFGKVATMLPSSFLETLSIFCHNLHATVAFPDENIYYLHRARAYQPFLISEAQGKELMNHLRRDMVKGIEKNFVYQIESDNCAKWVHETLVSVLGSDKVPEMFKIHLLETEPTSFVSTIFKAIKLLPSHWQTDVMTFFHLPLGAFRETWIYEQGKRVSKSLMSHEFWKTGIVFLPALLLKLKEGGALELLNVAIKYYKEQALFIASLMQEKIVIIYLHTKEFLEFLLVRRRRRFGLFRSCFAAFAPYHRAL